MSSEKKVLPMKREFSAGGCVYKKVTTKKFKPTAYWLIGKHSGYHKWVLPKGLIEEGEKGVETAVRETEEEMGVKARVVDPKPILKDSYWFVAELKDEAKVKKAGRKDEKGKMNKNNQENTHPVRRVAVYQEDPKLKVSKGEKHKVYKTVSFYLMEYEAGNPANHDWEMDEAGWYELEEALAKLAFEGERKALRKAQESISSGK